MMRKRKADKLEIRLAKLKAEYQELVLCDEHAKFISTGKRRWLAGKIAVLQERMKEAE